MTADGQGGDKTIGGKEPKDAMERREDSRKDEESDRQTDEARGRRREDRWVWVWAVACVPDRHARCLWLLLSLCDVLASNQRWDSPCLDLSKRETAGAGTWTGTGRGTEVEVGDVVPAVAFISRSLRFFATRGTARPVLLWMSQNG